jgi:hypothetical protein
VQNSAVQSSVSQKPPVFAAAPEIRFNQTSEVTRFAYSTDI